MNYTLTIIKDQKSLENLRQFLKANRLPFSDLTLEGSYLIGYHDEGGKLVGSGGLEFYGHAGLLRSVAVDKKLRGQSFGKKIVEAIVNKAKSLNVKDLYLLTETAHTYFLRKGFQDVPREIVPNAIQQSAEFSHVCPVSAIAMKLIINE